MYAQLVKELGKAGFAVQTDFVDPVCFRSLNEHLLQEDRSGRFKKARVGKTPFVEPETGLAEKIRGDRISWFDFTRTPVPAQRVFIDRLGKLKNEINRTLFLGLWDLEGHYAIYSAGAFYRRHLDRFQDDDARAVSIVFYLNRNWQKGDGGELVLHHDASARPTLIEPIGGTLVIFLSELIEHEVLESRCDRLSFAGWYCRRRPANVPF